MLIFFGSRNSELKRSKIEGTCSNCGSENCLEAVVYQRLAHIFYAPIFPLGKTGLIYCKNCFLTLPKERVGSHFGKLYSDIEAKVKTPWWVFSGSGGFVLFLIIIFTISRILTSVFSKQTQEYINSPKEGDIYEVRTIDNHFTLYYVVSLSKDSVYFVANKYEVKTVQGLRDLRNEMYDSQMYSISRKDLIQKYRTREIFRIERER